MNSDVPARGPVKCCSLHPGAMNRADRRTADRRCFCRGECGTHPAKLQPARAGA